MFIPSNEKSPRLVPGALKLFKLICLLICALTPWQSGGTLAVTSSEGRRSRDKHGLVLPRLCIRRLQR
jgi:hypothetical protein